MDYADTVGRFTIYWDRRAARFMVFDTNDVCVYVEPETRIVRGKMIRPTHTAAQWARLRESHLVDTFGDCEPGTEYE